MIFLISSWFNSIEARIAIALVCALFGTLLTLLLYNLFKKEKVVIDDIDEEDIAPLKLEKKQVEPVIEPVQMQVAPIQVVQQPVQPPIQQQPIIQPIYTPVHGQGGLSQQEVLIRVVQEETKAKEKEEEPKTKETKQGTDNTEMVELMRDLVTNVNTMMTRPQPQAQPQVQPVPVPVPVAMPAAVPAPAPVFVGEAPKRIFTLSREDIFDHVANMNDDQRKFPIGTVIKKRSEEGQADYYMCGGKTFAMVFDRNEKVFNIFLQLDKDIYGEYIKQHGATPAHFLQGDGWYNFIIDASFFFKKQVYDLLDAGYFSILDSVVQEQEKEKLQKEQEILEQQAASSMQAILDKTIAASKHYESELEKYKAKYYSPFLITRKEIAEKISAQNDPNTEVVLRPKNPQLPMSLKQKGKTYSMLHGTDEGVIMVVRIPSDFADELSKSHPEICRASFPAGANWYHVPIDGAFSDKASVYRLLETSKNFVESLALAKKTKK